MKLINIFDANDNKHKYIALFQTENGLKKIKFGAFGYEDYTQHQNTSRKKQYLARHESNEYWDNPLTAGSLSRWLLWNKPTLNASIKDFKKRFNI